MSSSRSRIDSHTEYREGILRSALRYYELELRSAERNEAPKKDGFDRMSYLVSRIRSLKRQLPAPTRQIAHT